VTQSRNERQLRAENKLLKNQVKNQENIKPNNSITSSRINNFGFLMSSHKGDRDYFKQFGYPNQINFDNYLAYYKRNSIGSRIIETYPDHCWKSKFKIIENETESKDSVFEKESKELFKNTRLKIVNKLKRADILTGLGDYGVLYIGVADGKKPSEPLEGNININDILYISPKSSRNAVIDQYDENINSPRYGLPLMYNIHSGDYATETLSTANKIMKGKQTKVHHSRIIHIVENPLENDVIGQPRLEKVFNDLIDLMKVKGGGSEMFWLNGRGGMSLESEADTNFTEDSAKDLESHLQDFSNSLTRFLKTKGIEAKPINFDVANPENHFNIIIKCISSATKIPIRILLGSEAGSLASTQDENNFKENVMNRQIDFCENVIILPLINWFIEHGVLPTPKNDFKLEWPNLIPEDTAQNYKNADVVATALQKYMNTENAEAVMPFEQFFEIMGKEYQGADANDID
jgi:hypothetical protein